MGIQKMFRSFLPPPKWRFPVLIILSIFVGLGLYTFYLSKAHSYLSDNPSTCVNCHVMGPQYATWANSSHRENAHCNDCHVPHDNAINHYYFKAKDGLRHATIFTLRNEPQVIQIKEAGKEVVHDNCLRCHGELISNNKAISSNPIMKAAREGRVCWDCHRLTPHGKVNSLSSTPNARVPVPESPVPKWLKKILKNKNN